MLTDFGGSSASGVVFLPVKKGLSKNKKQINKTNHKSTEFIRKLKIIHDIFHCC